MKSLSVIKATHALCVFTAVLLCASFNVSAQDAKTEMRVAFWNLENFFDPFADSTRVYNEFTENGGQHWTFNRFFKKRNNIYKAILALSQNKPLAIMGLAEVENLYVLNALFVQTPLKNHNYRIIHYEGDDRRGIDVAMVYCIDKLQLIYSEPIKVRNPKNSRFRTRDILYAKFSDRKGDTLHCFVNHWPSRYGGEMETIELRALAANTLKHKVDSLNSLSKLKPKIIVMGDLNDSPEDASVRILTDDCGLVNLFGEGRDVGFEGTLKHQYNWQVFDHIVISKSLIDNAFGMRYKKGSESIFHADFLFEKDNSFGGVRLFRTYVGPKYFGGYSDHLPVYIDLNYK